MEKVHFQARWIPEEGLFKLRFQFITGEDIKNSPAYWDIESDKFLKMVEGAEEQLLVHDGQNKVGKSSFSFDFVDKLGNDCQVNLSMTNRETFGQLTEYLRQVYDSWYIWKNQASKN